VSTLLARRQGDKRPRQTRSRRIHPTRARSIDGVAMARPLPRNLERGRPRQRARPPGSSGVSSRGSSGSSGRRTSSSVGRGRSASRKRGNERPEHNAPSLRYLDEITRSRATRLLVDLTRIADGTLWSLPCGASYYWSPPSACRRHHPRARSATPHTALRTLQRRHTTRSETRSSLPPATIRLPAGVSERGAPLSRAPPSHPCVPS
jgi:hypothetical protein